VRLARESGKPLAQIAQDLGVAWYESLRHWLKQADLDAGRRTDGLTTEEREELRRLRRENRVLREEREILRKAAAYFAQETGPRRLPPSGS
jgi:transposase